MSMHHGRFLCHVHVRALYWFRQDRSLDRMPVAGSWQYTGLWKLVRALRACGGSGVGGIRGVWVDVVGGGVVSAQTGGGVFSIDLQPHQQQQQSHQQQRQCFSFLFLFQVMATVEMSACFLRCFASLAFQVFSLTCNDNLFPDCFALICLFRRLAPSKAATSPGLLCLA